MRTARAESPANVFGTIFGELIRQGEENRRQREGNAILVRRMQAALQRLGYYQGAIDGNFGAGTQAAFVAYRRDHNIPLESQITEYDIADLETLARQASNSPQPAGDEEYEGDEGTGAEPPVEYIAKTPEEAWSDVRFSEFQGAMKGALTPPTGGGWIVVASAMTYENVIGAALKYARDFPGTVIVKSSNGRYGILIGWVSKPEAKQLVGLLKNQNIIPSDAFVSSGQKYTGPVWTTASSGMKTRNDVLRHGFFRASAYLWNQVLNGPGAGGFGGFNQRVSGVASSDGTESYLTLRRAPDVSAAELTRMPDGTLLKVLETRDGWSRIRLLDGREGWAKAKYLAFNADVMNGRASSQDEQSVTQQDNPYGDKDVQDRLISEGKTLLDETQQFLNLHPDRINNVSAFADAAVRLNTALTQKDYASIDATTKLLKQLLDGNADFKNFENELRRDRERREQEALQRAIKTASQNSHFLKTYITRHLTAPESPALTSLLKELEAAQRARALDAFLGVNQRIDATVSQYGLEAERKEIDSTYIPEPENSPGEGPAQKDEEPGNSTGDLSREETQRIRNDAQALVDLLQRYALTGKQVHDPVQTAQLVLNLRSSLKDGTATNILRDYKALADQLAKDNGFRAFQDDENYSEDLKKAREREAAEKEAERLIAFTQNFISKNYTSDKLDTIFDVMKQLRDAVKGGPGPDLIRTVEDARTRIERLDLKKELANFHIDDPAQKDQGKQVAGQILVTNENRPLLEGDGADILLLFNNTASAEGVRRDLLGKLTFSPSVPFCWYHNLPGRSKDVLMAYQALESAGAQNISVTGQCDKDSLGSTGIVGLRRRDFLANDREYAKPLVDLFVSGALVPVTTVVAKAVQQRQSADEKMAAAIADDVKAGRRKGYGVMLAQADGGELCTVAGAQQDALASLIRPRLKSVSGELAAWQLTPVQSADDAFAALRAGKCGGAIFDATGLAQLLAATEREKLPYRVYPLWIDEAELIAAQQRIEDEKAASLRDEEKRKRDAADAAKQEEIRLQALGETKRQEEATLRSRFGETAHGLAVSLGDAVKAFTDNPNDAGGRDTASLLPVFSRWYQDQLASGWELESGGFGTTLFDYGTVLWQNREVGTVFIQTVIRMKHRDLGKYQSNCYVLGAVVDSEFSRYRDVFERPCDTTNPSLTDWKAAHRFSSRWIID